MKNRYISINQPKSQSCFPMPCRFNKIRCKHYIHRNEVMTMKSIVKIRMHLLFPVKSWGMNDFAWWVGDVCGLWFVVLPLNFEERVPSSTYPVNNIQCIKCSRDFFVKMQNMCVYYLSNFTLIYEVFIHK